MSTLAQRQAALVAALVAGGAVPAGFDPALVRAAGAALLRKRAGEVAALWPMLAAGYGPDWGAVFGQWATERGGPPRGALRDGWDYARSLGAGSLGAGLPPLAEEELARREVRLRYDGMGPPRRRLLPAIRRVGSVIAVQLVGRCTTYRLTKSASPGR